MAKIELFSANEVPYAQRVRLALLEKRLDFLHTEIDLANKPEWFLVISPLGEVSVIRHEDRFIADSMVILEYLEDVFPTPSLRPEDPAKRALIRFWIEFADEKLAPAMLRCIAASENEAEEATAKLRDLVVFIEREGMARLGRGPYWLGQEVSLVDLALYPFFERLPSIQRLWPSGLPVISIRLRYWFDAMRQRESVRTTQNPPEFYARHFSDFASPRPRRQRIGNVEYLYV